MFCALPSSTGWAWDELREKVEEEEDNPVTGQLGVSAVGAGGDSGTGSALAASNARATKSLAGFSAADFRYFAFSFFSCLLDLPPWSARAWPPPPPLPSAQCSVFNQACGG